MQTPGKNSELKLLSTIKPFRPALPSHPPYPPAVARNMMLAKAPLQRAAPASRRGAVRVCASGNAGLATKFKEGDKVKVIGDVKVFSSPKHPQGLELKGMTGVVKVNVQQFQGKILSTVQPYRCEFMADVPGGKPQKVLAHLVRRSPACWRSGPSHRSPLSACSNRRFLSFAGRGGAGGGGVNATAPCLSAPLRSRQPSRALGSQSGGWAKLNPRTDSTAEKDTHTHCYRCAAADSRRLRRDAAAGEIQQQLRGRCVLLLLFGGDGANVNDAGRKVPEHVPYLAPEPSRVLYIPFASALVFCSSLRDVCRRGLYQSPLLPNHRCCCTSSLLSLY